MFRRRLQTQSMTIRVTYIGGDHRRAIFVGERRRDDVLFNFIALGRNASRFISYMQQGLLYNVQFTDYDGDRDDDYDGTDYDGELVSATELPGQRYDR